MGIDDFVADLARIPNTELAANPYRNEACRNNLRDYLRFVQREGFGVMLVGEAPGYRGCARTGIPFTDELQLKNARNEFALGRWERRMPASALPESPEGTATSIWSVIRESKLVPLMWNIYPFHPRKQRSARGNRTPTSAELAEGLRFTEALVSMFNVDHDLIYAVGRKAQRQLGLGDDHYLRHPSYGGVQLFAKHFASKVIADV